MNKPTKFITGMLAMALVFGMMAVGCDHNGGGGTSVSVAGTTWQGVLPASMTGGTSGTIRLTFTDKTATLLMSAGGQSQSMSGDYTVSGNKITMNDPNGDGNKFVFTVNGNQMTLVAEGETLTFTKVQ